MALVYRTAQEVGKGIPRAEGASFLPGGAGLVVDKAKAMAAAFGLRPHLAVNAPTDQHYWFDFLDAIGPDAILEHIASGIMPVEIALTNGIPHLFMRRWMDKNVDPADMAEALSIAAEVAVLKSQIALDNTPSNPGMAMIMKAESDRFAWVAERLDSKKWGSPGKAVEKPPAVIIEMNFGGGNVATLSVGGEATAPAPQDAAPVIEGFLIEEGDDPSGSIPYAAQIDAPVTREALNEQFLLTFGRLPSPRTPLKMED